MTNHRQPGPRSGSVVCTRYQADDLKAIEAAAEIMGQTISAFLRSSSVALAKAVIEASVDTGLGPGEGSWDRSWIEGATIERNGP